VNLNLKGFSQLIEDMSAALQSSATTLVDVSVGSVIRAIFEANASVALWIQWLILQVLQTTRASTSIGSDLDSWMLDFGLGRLPAVPSTGIVNGGQRVIDLAAGIFGIYYPQRRAFRRSAGHVHHSRLDGQCFVGHYQRHFGVATGNRSSQQRKPAVKWCQC
jgi:uncharacterized phage protein gp47/JayE